MVIALHSGKALEEPKTSNVKGKQAVTDKDAHVEEAKCETKNANEIARPLCKFFLNNPPIL